MPADPIRVRDVFLAAAEKPAAERDAYLDDVCGTDAELHAEVQRLLAAHAEPASILEPAPVAATVTYKPVLGPGAIIADRYVLVSKIGEGGMGEVWVAKQNEPVKRKVALKLIKTGMDSKAVLARFEAERQALAMMDHPNIAKVLDAGITAAGQPFFVMELVNGMALTKFCDDARLTPRERLELFVPICQAVQHAHQKGIVHRDLKPANILVTLYDGRPVPKVIDFGVAKALAGKLTEESLSTQFGAVVGTFEYMAPEQAGLTAIDIDTRADIYSLGVILYELLTGLRPFDGKRLRKAALDEMVRIIREEEPSKPSTRLSTDEALPSLAAVRRMEPNRLMALLRGDLDSMVMKAMEKDRNRRYETANGFARDVQRFLADEPVEAQPPSLGYRLGKFLKRNKGTVLATSVIAALLLIGLFTGTAGILWHEKVVADQAAADARRDAAEVKRKADDERRQTQLDAAEAKRKADDEQKQAQLDAAEAKRKADAERKQTLAERKITEAVEQAEKSRAEYQAVLRQSGGVFELLNEPKRWQAQIKLAREAVDRAKAVLANADAEAPANPDFNARIRHLETLLSRDEADRVLALKLEKIHSERFSLEQKRPDLRRPAEQYARAFAEFRAADIAVPSAEVAAQLAALPIKEQLVSALDDWAVVSFGIKQESLSERLLEIGRRAAPDPVWGDRLRQIEVRREKKVLQELIKAGPPSGMSVPLLSMVGAFLPAGDPAKVAWLRQARDHYQGDFWLNVELGTALQYVDPVEAAGCFRAALVVRPKSAYAYGNLGAVLALQKKLPEAVAAFQKAIELDSNYAYAHDHLGIALRTQNKLAAAIAAHEKALKIDPNYGHAYNNLGITLRDQKKLPEAIAAFRKAVKLDPDDDFALHNLGNALIEDKKLSEGAEALRKAVALEPKDPFIYNSYGQALLSQQKYSEAIAAFQKAIKADLNYVFGYYNVGIALRDQDKQREAIVAFRKAADLDPKFAAAYSNLGEAFRKLKKYPEAVAAFQKAVDIEPKNPAGYFNLGNLQLEYKKLPEAVAEYETAIDLDPKFAAAYLNLGTARKEQKNLPAAATAYRKAIALNQSYPIAYYNLGNVLHRQKNLPEAIAVLRKAISLAPAIAEFHCNLGHVLKDNGEFAEALKAMQKGHALGSKRPGWPYQSADWVKHCETLLALENKLGPVLKDRAEATPAEFLEMAAMCQQYQKRYAAAVSLYRRAFKTEPKLADDPGANHRQSAAIAAVLAGTSAAAKDALTAAEKIALRQQARDWLQADLDLYAKLVKDGTAESIGQSELVLAGWQANPDLADVRGAKIDALPEAERAAWHKLWANVDEVLKDVRAHITEMSFKGGSRTTFAPLPTR